MKTKQTVKYGGIDLPVINSKDALVPTSATKIDLDINDKRALAFALTANKPALLVGETGTGKTSAVKELAFLTQRAYIRVNMTGYTTPDELIGSKSVKDGATYYEQGIVTDAMRRGAILVLDEINATTPDCMFILHGLLDDDKRITLPNGDVINPDDNFRVFATCNPDYEGTKSLNKALIDRFPVIINVDTLSPKKEQQLLVDRTHINADVAGQLVLIASMLRKDYIESKISTFTSTRTLMHIGDMVHSGMDMKQAYTLALVHKTQQADEQKLLVDVYNSVLKMATENTDSRKVVITTQGEIDQYKNQVETYKNRADSAREALDRKEQEMRVLGESVQKMHDEATQTSIRVKGVLEQVEIIKNENIEMKEKLSHYQWLEKRIAQSGGGATS